MHRNGPVLAKLLFSFVHLADKVDESFPWFWHSLLRPISELELTNRPGLAILTSDKCIYCFIFLQTSRGESVCLTLNTEVNWWLTLASVTLNSRRMYWGMLYSAIGSTTKYWYLAERSAGQYWWHFSCGRHKASFQIFTSLTPLIKDEHFQASSLWTFLCD